MADKIKTVGKSLIQYGKENNRIYLMKLAKEDCPEIVDYMDNLATNDGFTKIVAKVPLSSKNPFLSQKYVQEAIIKNFYKGKEDACFLCKYFSKEREHFDDKNDILVVAQFCIEKATLAKKGILDEKFCIKKLTPEFIPKMLDVYRKIFESYPFPIHDGKYILQTMKENIDYYGVFEEDKIVALSSSEMDLENLNTEMTDFATLPEYRGKNLSYHLLKTMEKDAKEKGLKTAYTISRAKNPAINMIFAKCMYEFGGTLINNTNICGTIETMNVWYKNI